MDITDPLSTLADSNKGLPQLYRSRSRLSSELSEDGGEGSSRRGSFSDTSSVTRGVPTAEVAAGSATGDTGPRNRPITPLDDDVILKVPPPDHPLESVPLSKTQEGAMIPNANTSSQQKPSLSYSGDWQPLEPSTQPLEQSLSAAHEEDSLPDPLLTSTRPPPLRLMSQNVDPILSPILTSPMAGVRPSLPLLSPLLTTPTQTAKPHTIPITSPSRVVANLPQLTPTTPSTIKSPLGTPNSAHRPSLGATLDTEAPSTDPKPQHVSPNVYSVPNIGTDSGTKQLASEAEPLHHIHVQQKSNRLLLRPSPGKVVASEPIVDSASREAKPASSEVEQLSSEEPPSPTFATEPAKLTLERQTSISPTVLPSTLSLQQEDDPDVERGGEDESITSSLSSKPASPEIPAMEERGEKEEPEGDGVQKEGRNDRSENLGLDVAGDFDVEVGGEGGVASILHGEDEMELPDIEKQLEMSESEDSSSGSSESENELDPSQSTGEILLQSVKNQGEIVVAPPMSSVHSSSHSLASTPSDSPSPSPIPHSSPLPSQYPIPISTSDPSSYLTPSLPPPPTREQPKAKPVFSINPKPIPGSLVVSFRRTLIPSYTKAKKRGGRCRRGAQQQPPAPKVSKEVVKLKRPSFTAVPTALEGSEAAARPLVVSISRSHLFVEPFGLAAAVPQSGGQFSDNDDDEDMIVTHSSAERVKVKTPRVKPEIIGSERVKSSQGPSMERVTVSQQRFSRHPPSSPSAEGGVVGGVAMGVWKRELDISEMGLLPPAPVRPTEEQQVILSLQNNKTLLIRTPR